MNPVGIKLFSNGKSNKLLLCFTLAVFFFCELLIYLSDLSKCYYYFFFWQTIISISSNTCVRYIISHWTFCTKCTVS